MYRAKKVSCTFFYGCCVTTDGEVFIWDYEHDPSLTVLSEIEVPKKIQIEKICDVACGDNHLLLLCDDRKTVLSFGCNKYGQLGREGHVGAICSCCGLDKMNGSQDFEPIKVPFLGEREIRKLQCTSDASAVLTEDGQIILWGGFSLMDENNKPELRDDYHIPRTIQTQQE